MPDLVQMIEAMVGSAVAAAVVVWLIALPPGPHRPARIAVSRVLGMAVGSCLGFVVLRFRPHWPPIEDQDRFFVLVLPSLLAVDLLGVVSGLRRRWVLLSRGTVTAAAAPTLLYGSTYLADVAGPGSREWPPALAMIVLVGLGLAFATEWLLLDRAIRRVSPTAAVGALAVSIVAASITIMLSGYATGGQMGLPLAAALAGAWASGMIVRDPRPCEVPLAAALGGLFSLLVVGRFFARLTSVHAILLFCAPLLCAASELPFLRWLAPWPRAAASVLLVGCLVAGVVVSAWIEFAKDTL
jgi:hypothetical protein